MLIILFACSAFFSSAETALFSLNSIQIHRIRKNNKNSGECISSLLSNPSKLLSTILIGNTIVNVMASALGFAFIKNFYPTYAAAISIPPSLIWPRNVFIASADREILPEVLKLNLIRQKLFITGPY